MANHRACVLQPVMQLDLIKETNGPYSCKTQDTPRTKHIGSNWKSLLELLEYDFIFSLKGHSTLNFKKILTTMKYHDDSWSIMKPNYFQFVRSDHLIFGILWRQSSSWLVALSVAHELCLANGLQPAGRSPNIRGNLYKRPLGCTKFEHVTWSEFQNCSN